MLNLRSATLWAADTTDARESLPMHMALAIATAITLLAIVCFNFLPQHRAIQAIKKVMQVSLVQDAPQAVIEPPPVINSPPTLIKKIKKMVKETPQPVQNSLQTAVPVAVTTSNVMTTPVAATVTNTVTTTSATPSTSAPLVTQETKTAAQTATPSGTVEIGVVCATQVKPVLPRRAITENISGKVTARITISGAKVMAVEIVNASPKGIFNAAVRQAMMQYQCAADGMQTVVAEQTFDFNMAE